jgi:hypothetical protein
MAESILHKSPPKGSKKTSTKQKNPTPAAASIEGQKPEEASIPLYREELFRLHDIVAGLKLLRDVAQEAPELQLIQVEILIKKAARDAWNLIHETLDSRWQDRNPDADLVRND